MKAILLLGLFAVPAWASAPAITAVVPAEVSTAGGTITLQGSGFADDATVKVGGYPCTGVNVVSATELSCTAGVNIARHADVTLVNADGGSAIAQSALEYKGVPGFALLQQRVFQRFGVNSSGVTVVLKCTGCHGGSKPDGNLDMKDYSQVLKRVKPGEPDKSVLYTEARDGRMPPKERQPELKPEEKQALSDWIAAGALNN